MTLDLYALICNDTIFLINPATDVFFSLYPIVMFRGVTFSGNELTSDVRRLSSGITIAVRRNFIGSGCDGNMADNAELTALHCPMREGTPIMFIRGNPEIFSTQSYRDGNSFSYLVTRPIPGSEASSKTGDPRSQ